MSAKVEIQYASSDDEVPPPSQFQCWVEAALLTENKDAEVCIRVVGTDESQQLNQTYRQKSYPTNVLSFPSDLPCDIDLPLLGDLAICAPVVRKEATVQKKSLEAHWAHMVVHGTLHLQGFDHMDDGDADIMEAMETKILTALNYPPPYEFDVTVDCEINEGDRQN